MKSARPSCRGDRWRIISGSRMRGPSSRISAAGSLELIGAVDGLVEITTSLPLGAVRVTEQYLSGQARHSAPRSPRCGGASGHCSGRPAHGATGRNGVLIGSGGSFTNLARMAAARRGIVGEAIHGTSVGTGEVESLLEWLTHHDAEQRALVPGLNPQRADIILAGLAVAAELLVAARRAAAHRECLRTARGTAARDGRRRTASEGRSTSCASTASSSTGVAAIAATSSRCACWPCRSTTSWPTRSAARQRSAELLEAAAMLHDVGQLVSFRKHHLHSYQLIMHADRLGLGARDRTLVALISRYHRKRGAEQEGRRVCPAAQG